MLENFKCEKCGNCCKGEGIVKVSYEEFSKICKYLNISKAEALRYFFIKRGKIFIIRDKDNKECIFLRNNLCLINNVKPEQCKNFPLKWNTKEMLSECAGYRKLINEKNKNS